MEEMAISKFKATCLAAVERVRSTGQPLLITKRGVPVAQVLPPPPRRNIVGAMRGTVHELGDIVSPLGEDDWEAAQPGPPLN